MPARKKVKFGLFPKFLISFILIAVIPMLVIEYLSYDGMNRFRDQVVSRSKGIITRLSTANIRQMAENVAAQIEIYVKFNKEKSIDELKNDPYLKKIAVQRVGKTGYTAVHTTDAINVFHKNPKIVGMNLRKLKKKYPDFWKILEKSLKGPASGYYTWKDIHGKVRKKYMYCAPVKGTNLVVAATTYLDEFFGPMNELEKSADAQQKSIMLYVLVVSLGFIVYMVIFSYFYAKSITKPILRLAEVADRISVGDLDVEVDVKTNDEIMILVEAVTRMQKSLRSAIVRLRSKRMQGKRG